jgi:hypothetical protein
VTTLVGAVTEEEVDDHNQRLGDDPQFQPDFRQLVDLRAQTEILYDSEMVRDTSRKHVFSPGTRRALVASTDAVFGMARMFALQSETAGQTIQVFRDMREAEGWLDL